MLDGLYGHETRIEIDEHYVDTGGASDHVFSLFAIGGKRVAPRLRDLKDWRLHAFEDADAYSTLKHHIGDRIDAAAIREGWDEALRIYDWMREPQPEGIFRPLRTAKEKFRGAA